MTRCTGRKLLLKACDDFDTRDDVAPSAGLPARFHANYLLDIDTGRVLAGGLPPPMLRQARRWVRWRRQALLEAFTAALRHDDPSQIAAQLKEAIGEG